MLCRDTLGVDLGLIELISVRHKANLRRQL